MKWGSVLGIVFVVMFMVMFQWPKMNETREKVAFAVLTAVGFVLAVLLLVNPEMPGPTQLIDAVFKPLGELLEK
ncbi:hypothetical protein SD70_10955 [Gordoniibacillus kamchatkensis]|uniref:Stage III sporulation protein AC n=1 Tax=Gordoniibacillus kamchatkensis TaxID=1590651 RepID=A0ABR5AIB1_9BACL|nr:hypothetical protein [Paenibacillus sp. VKM B-2647]KIL40766.1 hypothetical protein SD70_10955 [Paenibacillus sp. VKM B-2647]